MSSHNRYAFLDGIRGFAALFILLRHTQTYWHFGFYRSYLAVDIFFILSGFVIAYAYDEKILCGELTVPRFMLVRFIRLYPVFILSVVLSLLAALHHYSAKDLVTMGATSALLLPSMIPGHDTLFPLNSVYWSLGFELAVNFLYATTRAKLTAHRLLWTLAAAWLGLTVAAVLCGNLNGGYLWSGPHILCGFLRAVWGIFLGLGLYRYRDQLAGVFPCISPWLACAMVAVVLTSPAAGFLDPAIDMLCISVIFPWAVVAAARGDPTFVRPMLVLGSASYPMYVLHLPLAALIGAAFPRLASHPPISGVSLIAFLIVVSVGLEKYYDIPVRRYLSSLKRPVTLSKDLCTPIRVVDEVSSSSTKISSSLLG